MMEQLLTDRLRALVEEKGRVLLALDGMSAAGKTTLAARLQEGFEANVYHMDDFYLPWEDRPQGWQQIPGGNMDLSRFREEVLLPLTEGKPVMYRAYSCKEKCMLPARQILPRPLEIVEGAYALHPALGRPYHLKAFVAIGAENQRLRILGRNGPEGLARFQALWLPMEGNYFASCGVREACDLMLEA